MSPSTKTLPSTRESALVVLTRISKTYADETNAECVPDWKDMEPEEIMEFLHSWRAIAETFHDFARDELMKRMDESDATQWPQGDFVADIKESPRYSGKVLSMLFEHGLKEELFECGAVEQVLKWNATKFKPYIKRGGPIAEIIANARSTYRSLKITRQKD